MILIRLEVFLIFYFNHRTALSATTGRLDGHGWARIDLNEVIASMISNFEVNKISKMLLKQLRSVPIRPAGRS